MEAAALSDKLLHWYKKSARDLPWRHTSNPYHIWLSEVILQQTRVNQGLPYYHAFLHHFPTIDLLANAQSDQVMRVWQGLGYYSRARNLHNTARYVHENLQGKFPESYAELIKLPGIGPYTAAAIASFAFKEHVAVLDGNVFRVLSRLFLVETDILSTPGKKQFSALALELLPSKNSDIYNQAIMELGALVCLPKNPDCGNCPLQGQCLAYSANKQAELPVKQAKAKPRNRYFHYLIIRHQNHLHLRQRKGKDIWNGLFEFWALETLEAEISLENWKLNWPADWPDLDAGKWRFLSSKKHQLTHQTLFAQAYLVDFEHRPKDMKFYSFEEIHQLPKPVLINKFFAELDKL